MSRSWLLVSPGLEQLSYEPPLVFEPTLLGFSESAVQHSTHRATRVLRRRGRQSLTRRVPLLPPFYFWVAPSPPWTRTQPDTRLANSWLPFRSWLTATRSWLTAARALPPCVSPGYPSTQKFQTGIVQYNQFTVSPGTFCHHMSCEPPLGFEPTLLGFSESAVQHSTHRATRVLRRRGRQNLTRRVPHYHNKFCHLHSLCEDLRESRILHITFDSLDTA